MPTCISCGRQVERLVDGLLCEECYLAKRSLGTFARSVKIRVCPKCGSFQYRGRWYPPPLKDLDESLATALQYALMDSFKPNHNVESYTVELRSLDLERSQAFATVKAKVRGYGTLSLDYAVKVEVEKRVCPLCLQKASRSPRAIVQIRSYGREGLSKEELDNIRAILVESASTHLVTSVDEVRGGVDIQFADVAAARQAAAKIRDAHAAIVRESHKIVGRRQDGKPVSRLTLSVRLPFFRVGDLVDFQGRLAVVERIERGYVYVRHLDGKLVRLQADDAWRELSRPEHVESSKAIVTAIEPGWIHLQKLEGDYDYVEVPLSAAVVDDKSMLRVGAEAMLYGYGGRYYILLRTQLGRHTKR
jgi:nonsense-mediated mRNA decay protein 3